MAAYDSCAGGYSRELFVSPVPEDFKCGVCEEVARDPHLADCCGEHFCRACIDQLRADGKLCPSCKENGFSVLVNKRLKKKIMSLEVRCAMKDRGCEWRGHLEQLDGHVNLDSGSCEYVDVDCPNECDQPVQKRHLAAHLANKCPKRDFTCQYCNFKATYDVVCNDHWPKCPFYLVPCPNGCDILAIERGDVDAHLMLCSLEEVECEFSHAGCKVKLVREEMERHLADNLQRHVLMMNKTLKEKIEQLESKLEQKEEQVREIREQLAEKTEEKTKQIEETEGKVEVLKDQLQGSIQQIEVLERLSGLRFTVPNFQKLKNDDDGYNAESLYTHPGGYKVCIRVRPNGYHSGHGTHVSAWLCGCPGDNDGDLKWPADCTITLQLLNQHRDQDHVTVTERFNWTRTKNVTAASPNPCLGHKLIAHKHLEWNAAEQTQYLKDDCLQFRIAKIQVHSL